MQHKIVRKPNHVMFAFEQKMHFVVIAIYLYLPQSRTKKYFNDLNNTWIKEHGPCFNTKMDECSLAWSSSMNSSRFPLLRPITILNLFLFVFAHKCNLGFLTIQQDIH